MNATSGLIVWAEALGEAIGRGIARQLSGALPANVVGAAAARPARNEALRSAAVSRRVTKPSRKLAAAPPTGARRGRKPRAVESTATFGAGVTVEYTDRRKTFTASVLTVDEDAGELVLLNLQTEQVVRRKPSLVRAVKAAPVLVRKKTVEIKPMRAPTWLKAAPSQAGEDDQADASSVDEQTAAPARLAAVESKAEPSPEPEGEQQSEPDSEPLTEPRSAHPPDSLSDTEAQ